MQKEKPIFVYAQEKHNATQKHNGLGGIQTPTNYKINAYNFIAKQVDVLSPVVECRVLRFFDWSRRMSHVAWGMRHLFSKKLHPCRQIVLINASGFLFQPFALLICPLAKKRLK